MMWLFSLGHCRGDQQEIKNNSETYFQDMVVDMVVKWNDPPQGGQLRVEQYLTHSYELISDFDLLGPSVLLHVQFFWDHGQTWIR